MARRVVAGLLLLGLLAPLPTLGKMGTDTNSVRRGLRPPVSLQVATRPAAASVALVGNGAARPRPAPGGSFVLDGAGPFTIHATCPGYDDMFATFRWDAATEHWHYRCSDARGRLVWPFGAPRAGDVTATEGTELHFWRTVRIHGATADTELAVDAPGGGRSVRVAGLEMSLVALQSYAPGTVIVPDALDPPPLYLIRPLFEPLVLRVPHGALAGRDVWPDAPVALTARYGPFSYRWFDAVCGAVVVAALGTWLGYWRPRAARRRRAETAQVSLAQSIVAEAEEGVRAAGAPPPLLGKTLETESHQRFVVLRRLGEGGMGVVFEAARAGGGDGGGADLDRWAVKVLLADTWDDADFRQRFLREVEVCSRLTHPGLVKVLDWGLHAPGADRTWPFMVMELVSGEELRHLIKDGRTAAAPPERIVGWLVEILRALGTAHAAGVIHRDLKPENIMITRSGHPKIMDFGLARQVDRKSLTRSGMAMGTPVYMSPEHVDAKRVTAASDVYSMGVIAYEMLSGRTPFEGDDPWSIVMQMMTADPQPLSELRPDLPVALTEAVMRMMARDPSQRTPDARGAVEALQAAVEAEG